MEGLKSKLDMARYTTPDTTAPEHEYEEYVKKTAKMIGRSYIATAKMVETWPFETIKRRYHDAEKDSQPAFRWFTLRKYNR